MFSYHTGDGAKVVAAARGVKLGLLKFCLLFNRILPTSRWMNTVFLFFTRVVSATARCINLASAGLREYFARYSGFALYTLCALSVFLCVGLFSFAIYMDGTNAPNSLLRTSLRSALGPAYSFAHSMFPNQEAAYRHLDKLARSSQFCNTTGSFARGSPNSVHSQGASAGVTNLRLNSWRIYSAVIQKTEDCEPFAKAASVALAESLTPGAKTEVSVLSKIPLATLWKYYPIVAVTEFESEEDQQVEFVLGPMRGVSALQVNGEKILFASNRSQIPSTVPVVFSKGSNSIKILNHGKGFASPIFPFPDFIGFYPRGAPQPLAIHLGDSIYDLQAIFELTAMFFLVLLLTTLEFSRVVDSKWPMSLALFILSLMGIRILQISGLQNHLDILYVRVSKSLFISGIVFSLLYTTLEVFENITRKLRSLTSSFETPALKSYRHVVDIFNGVALVLLCAHTVRIGFLDYSAPELYEKQYQLLYPLLGFGLALGAVLTIYSAFIRYETQRMNEDQAFKIVHQMYLDSMKFSFVTLGFCLSFFIHLRKWLSGENSSVFDRLQSYVFLMAVVFSTLWFLLRELRAQRALKVVIPLSIQEMIPKLSKNPLTLDQTSTEHNWILLNDIVGSSQLKLTHLDIVTHILQSVFHKIHKDYFKDTLHFLSSLGDAVLIALQAPKNSKHNDTILEKLVRSYSLHKDGVTTLLDSYNTVLSILRLHAKELYLAIQDRTSNELAGAEMLLSFRTLLSTEYYFYGLNHEVSNIDSKSIYLISKSEKLMNQSTDGGFVMFPALYDMLSLAFPLLPEYFEECLIDKERAKPELKKLLPHHAYILRHDKEECFRKYLETLYKGPLFLRKSPDSNVDYQVIRPEVKDATERVHRVQSLPELLKVMHQTPKFLSFIEKNHYIKSVSDRAVELNIWENELVKGKILKKLLQIGIPGGELFKSLAERDENLSPDQILRDLSAGSPVVRNKAMRFLQIARTRNNYRSHALSKAEFCQEVLKLVLPRISQFSIESHWALFIYIKNQKDAAVGAYRYFKCAEEEAVQAKLGGFLSDTRREFRDWVGNREYVSFLELMDYYQEQEAPSLKGLQKAYERWFQEMKVTEEKALGSETKAA